MQSVRAGAVQTHFSIFTLFLKNSSYMTSCGVHVGGSFHQKLLFLMKKGSKKVTAFPGWRPLGHLWSPKLIFDAKSEPTAPKVPPGTQTCFKNDPKRAKNDPKSDSEVHSLGTLTLDRRFEQRPGGLREALTIKRHIGE